MTRIPKDVFDAAIPRLVEIGWMEHIDLDGNVLTVIPQDDAAIPQDDAAIPQDDAVSRVRACARGEGKGREGNRREWKEENGSEEKRKESATSCGVDLSEVLPEEFLTDRFRSSWESWVKHRTEIRKPLKQTQVRSQLKMLESIGESRAVAMIDYTVAMGWQGLREQETNNRESSASTKPRLEPVDEWLAGDPLRQKTP
jgi:hypothetical protein